MATALPGVANTFGATMVAIADGSRITAGTVNFYLMAESGPNIGKWFQGADDSWQAAEAVAQAGTHKARGQWKAAIHAAAWVEGVTYRLYAEESGGLSIGYGYEIACEVSQDQAIGRAALGVSRVWFVAKDGADANSGGSWAAARLTIAAVTGDADFDDDQGIWLGPGTWTEVVDLSATSGIVAVGSGRLDSVITSTAHAGGDLATLKVGARTHLRNLDVRNTYVPVAMGDAVAILASGGGWPSTALHVLIEDCRIQSADIGLYLNYADDFCIRRSTIDASEFGIQVENGGGLIEDSWVYVHAWTICSPTALSYYHAIANDDRQLLVRGSRLFAHQVATIPNTYPMGVFVLGESAHLLLDGCIAEASQGAADGVGTASMALAASGGAQVLAQNSTCFSNPYDAAGDPHAVDKALDLYNDGADTFLTVAGCHFDADRVAGTILYAPPGTDILADTNELQSLGVKLSAQGKADLDQQVGRRNAMTLAWFVDTENGDDGDDGLSWGTAKETISGAAAEGDFGLPGTTQVVYVAGEPTESVDLVDAVSIQGGGGIWRFTAAVYNIRLGTGGAVRGFALERAAVAGEIVTATGDCVVEDCTLTATGGCKAVLGVASKIITLRRCVIKGALDATVGTIVVDQCRRESGADTGNVVYTSDIASRAVPGDLQVSITTQEVHAR